MSDQIKIGVSGFAECALAYPRISQRRLRPFKFNNKGEGAGRSGYYKRALDTIREFHKQHEEPDVFKTAKQELAAQINALDPTDFRTRTKLRKNIDALIAYEAIYGDRKFLMHPRHRLSVRIGNVLITAQPDLWVSEHGIEVLIKIGTAKKKQQHVDILIYLLRKAAISSGHRIRARNVVYLDITNGKEHCCRTDLARFNRMFRNVAQKIEQEWTGIGE